MHRASPYRVPPSAAFRLVAAALALLTLLIAYVPLHAPQAQAAAPGSVRWGYHVNFDSNSGLASLRAHIGKLTHLSPRWFLLDAAGALTQAPDPNRGAITNLARSAGVKLLPYVRNTAPWDQFTPFLSNPQARAAAVASITNTVLTEGYDGIHVDFEEINGTDRDRLTQFITELAAALHARGKLMSQAMGPKIADTGSSWAAGWDYAALGKVNDLVVIMAYTAPGKAPHPIGGAGWSEQNLAYALSRIPAEKVLLGIPFYGYDWNTSTGDTGAALTGPQAQALAAAHGVTPAWNEAEQEYAFDYTKDGQQHRVGYSDRRSVEYRLGLAGRYGLAGAAFWRIGQEEPGVWTLLTPPPPTATAVPTSTAMPVPPTATATATAAPTHTPTAVPPTATATSTATVPPPSPTATATDVPTSTPMPSATATSTATATATATETPAPATSPTSADAPPAGAAASGVVLKGESFNGGLAALAVLGVTATFGIIGVVRRRRRGDGPLTR